MSENIVPTRAPLVFLFATDEPLREATADEVKASTEAAARDGGQGIIQVDGFRAYAVPFDTKTEAALSCDLCGSAIADEEDSLVRTRAGAIVTACAECAERFVAKGYGQRTT